MVPFALLPESSLATSAKPPSEPETRSPVASAIMSSIFDEFGPGGFPFDGRREWFVDDVARLRGAPGLFFPVLRQRILSRCHGGSPAPMVTSEQLSQVTACADSVGAGAETDDEGFGSGVSNGTQPLKSSADAAGGENRLRIFLTCGEWNSLHALSGGHEISRIWFHAAY